MKQTRKRIVSYIAAGCALLLADSAAYAVPSLGVATEYGYIGETGQTVLEDYQDYFVDTLISGTDALHGFLVGPSGSDLIVFTDIIDTEIFLLTSDDIYTNNNPRLNGQTLTNFYDPNPANGQQITGEFVPLPNWGVSLGAVDPGNPGDWVALPNSGADDFPGSQQFYSNHVTLTYDGAIAPSSYFFAVADDDSPAGVSKGDSFSPPTSSATGAPVPEPGTMMLFGAGLLGLTGVARKTTKRS